jgi:outer membrane immunogenic protein
MTTTRYLAALLVSTCLSAPAFAADLPVKAPTAAQPVVADWTGFYLGIHGGYGWGESSIKDTLVQELLSEIGFNDPKPKGGLFGGQAGYLWQRGNFVGGFEIDYSFASLKDSQSVDLYIRCLFDGTLNLEKKIDALASARARAGFLIGPDLYVYGTGGIGWARTKGSLSACEEGDCIALKSAENHFGWVAGAGGEYRLWQNVSLGVTYLHYDFGTTNNVYTLDALPIINAGVRTDLTVDVVRGALNFRF